jgi:hypothetical protein
LFLERVLGVLVLVLWEEHEEEEGMIAIARGVVMEGMPKLSQVGPRLDKLLLLPLPVSPKAWIPPRLLFLRKGRKEGRPEGRKEARKNGEKVCV